MSVVGGSERGEGEKGRGRVTTVPTRRCREDVDVLPRERRFDRGWICEVKGGW